MVGIEAQAAGTPVVCSDSVTSELDVGGFVYFVPLAASQKEWCEAIHGAKRAGVIRARKQLTDNHYNIKNEVKDMETFYDRIGG